MSEDTITLRAHRHTTLLAAVLAAPTAHAAPYLQAGVYFGWTVGRGPGLSVRAGAGPTFMPDCLGSRYALLPTAEVGVRADASVRLALGLSGQVRPGQGGTGLQLGAETGVSVVPGQANAVGVYLGGNAAMPTGATTTALLMQTALDPQEPITLGVGTTTANMEWDGCLLGG